MVNDFFKKIQPKTSLWLIDVFKKVFFYPKKTVLVKVNVDSTSVFDKMEIPKKRTLIYKQFFVHQELR